MRHLHRMAAIAALLLGGVVGGGFVPIEPRRDDELDDEPDRAAPPEPEVERPIAQTHTSGWGNRAARRRAQRGAR